MATGQFTCEACGKTYAWKPQLAGKRVKCKCGAAMSVPAEDPAAAAAPPPEFEDLYALAEGTPVDAPIAPPPLARAAGGAGMPALAVAGGGAGPDLAPAPARPGRGGIKGPKPAAGGGGGGGGTAGAGKKTKPNLLGYAQMGGGKRHLSMEERERGGDVFFHPVKDLYIPGGLVVAGMIILYFVMMYHRGVNSAALAMLAVGLLCFINVVLTVPGILVTIRLFDLGIGPIGPGIVKLAACAIAPGAIGELVDYTLSGTFARYLGWCLSLVLSFTIFMKLLDMDFFETMVCSCIIWVIQTWLGYALLFALLSGLGVSGLPVAGIGGGGGGGRINLAGEVHVNEDESLDNIRAKQNDEEALGILVGPGGVEGKEWIEGNANRLLAKHTREESLALMRDLYAAPVKEVRVYPEKDAKAQEVTDIMVVCPHEDNKAARDKVVEHMKKLSKKLGRVTYRDRGEKYIIVRLMTSDDYIKAAGAGGPGGAGGGTGGTVKPLGSDDDE